MRVSAGSVLRNTGGAAALLSNRPDPAGSLELLSEAAAAERANQPAKATTRMSLCRTMGASGIFPPTVS
jgi:hypothetical protein